MFIFLKFIIWFFSTYKLIKVIIENLFLKIYYILIESIILYFQLMPSRISERYIVYEMPIATMCIQFLNISTWGSSKRATQPLESTITQSLPSHARCKIHICRRGIFAQTWFLSFNKKILITQKIFIILIT